MKYLNDYDCHYSTLEWDDQYGRLNFSRKYVLCGAEHRAGNIVWHPKSRHRRTVNSNDNNRRFFQPATCDVCLLLAMAE